jgi:hypothetical protein
MKISEFNSDLINKLSAQLISPRILLDRLRLVDDTSRQSSQYQDPLYLPFYFHLSKYIYPKTVLQVGLNLGLEICCFLQGNKNIDRFYGFQNSTDDYYSERMALSNIRSINKKILIDYYYGKIYDKTFLNNTYKFDFIIINEKSNFDQIKDALDFCWEKLNLDGILVLDFLKYDKKINEIFLDFCKSQNRDGQVYKTRYGTGIIQK